MNNTMSNDSSISQLAIPQTAARLASALAALFLVLLAVLHLLKPELDPSWRVISEYALGKHGWIMVLAFLVLAVSLVSLAVALRTQLQSIWGRIGLLLLLISAVGMALAGIFVTDPLTASAAARTTQGRLHEVGALLDLTPFAALIINLSLARNPTWRAARRVLFWTAGLPLLGLLIFIAATVVMLPSDGQFGPDVLIGWSNRFLVVTYCVWVMTVAWQAIRLGRQNL
jgi:Protein of unknown function (DUF998)